jgi:DNA-binding CsgD family transcriptional regulator
MMSDYLVAAFTWTGDFESCPEMCIRLIEYERAVGALGMLPLTLSGYAHYLFRTGNWIAGRAAASEALELARETRQYFELAHALVAALSIEAATGRFGDAREHANELMPIGESPGMRSYENFAFGALSFLEVSAGNFATAKALLMRNRELAATCGIRHPTLVLWQPDLVDVAWSLGDRRLAQEISEELTADAIHNTLPYGLALAARCRGTVAVDIDEARAEFEAALQLHNAVSDPFQRARTYLAYGERLVGVGAADDATASLTAAAETFERLGAVPWARRARRHLPEVEVETDRGAASPLELLSPRELQVALLVVDGKTSRDVAGELFLSRRTVEFHLAAIYRKLGVANRTHLARVLYPHVEPSL